MKEITGNLFDCIGKVDAICITTNGFVKANGEAVMGKGCAKEATHLWPDIARTLGSSIKYKGNVPDTLIYQAGTVVVSFPVKPVFEIFTGSNAVRHMINKFQVGDIVPGWACLASLDIIEKSVLRLRQLADEHSWKTVILPRPGCGAGELNWHDVKPILDKHLDDRFGCITFK